MKKIELPEEMMPGDIMRGNASDIDNIYKDMYSHLTDALKDQATTSEIIAVMSQYFVERLVLMVGENINEYDKNILRGVIERHIVEVVFVE